MAKWGQSKHRTVGMSEETPQFKKKRIKSRKKNKLAKQARKKNRAK